MLPGGKVTEEIAQIRGLRVGEDAFSPNRHIDIKNNGELLDMIHRIREVTGKPVGFKTVLSGSEWFDQLFSLINERGKEYAPDFITIDGADGGTGAAPMALIDAVGLSLRESLYIAVDKLNEYGLRHHVKVIASGKLIVPADVAWALCVGADFVVSARGFMFSLGCIQSLQCARNSCPTGITTHNPKLQEGLVPEVKSVRVANYVDNLMHEVRIIAHSCGIHSPHDFKRHHARVVTADGTSVPLDIKYPPVRNRKEV